MVPGHNIAARTDMHWLLVFSSINRFGEGSRTRKQLGEKTSDKDLCASSSCG